MLRLRVLTSATRPLLRTNATLASATGATETSPPASSPVASTPAKPAKPVAASGSSATKKAKDGKAAPSKGVQQKEEDRPNVRPPRIPAKRRNINLQKPREWNRPLAPGVLPAYDEALRVIQADSYTIKAQLAEVNARIEQCAEGEELDKLREKAHILEVQSEINSPEVRWKFRNKMADMSKPVYRHLAEQKWRKEGGLDLVMERIHQMKVVPDILPDLHPSLDLRVTFAEPPPEDLIKRTRTKRKPVPIEAGVMLLPEQTRRRPTLYVTAFHPERRYYTLLMVDPDVPAEESASYSTYLHWMQPNVKISAFGNRIQLPKGHTPYIPPHPQQGTPYHRYVLLLLPHPDPNAPIEVPTISPEQRHDFNVRAFAEHYGLDATKGGGAFMWREVWSEEVSAIYRDTLKLPEPRYGRPRKFDPYAALKAGGRQYPSPAVTSPGRGTPSARPTAQLSTADAAAAEVNAVFNAAEIEGQAEAKDGTHHHASAVEEAEDSVAMGLAPEEPEIKQQVRA